MSHIAASVSFTVGANNKLISLRIVKNGTPAAADAVASTQDRKVGTGADVGSTAVHADMMLTNGDYIELWVTNETDTTSVTVEHLYLFGLAIRTA